MRIVPAVLCAAAAGGVLASCSGEGDADLATATTGTSTVTVTVTMTPTPTPTTSTSSPTTPTGAGSVPASAATPGSPTTTTSLPPFSRTLAEEDLADVVADIGVLDTQFAQNAAPALRLRVLAAHFAALTADGVPPGLDGPSYRARLASLEIFAVAAADEATADPVQAAARYEVIRTETGVLLTQVNGALGTTFALPPRTGATTTPTSPGGTGPTTVPVPPTP